MRVGVVPPALLTHLAHVLKLPLQLPDDRVCLLQQRLPLFDGLDQEVIRLLDLLQLRPAIVRSRRAWDAYAPQRPPTCTRATRC